MGKIEYGLRSVLTVRNDLDRTESAFELFAGW